jgi:hypothetical protein
MYGEALGAAYCVKQRQLTGSYGNADSAKSQSSFCGTGEAHRLILLAYWTGLGRGKLGGHWL